MKITVYTKSGCPNCVSAKQLLKSNGLEYEERALDEERLFQFQVLYPDARQMPQIFIDGQRVGGLAGLQAALKQVGL
jgi:glutaredoxin